MNNTQRKEIIEPKKAEAFEVVLNQLKKSGDFEDSDIFIIDNYAQELGFIEALQEELLNTAPTKKNEQSRVRLSRMLNAHMNTAENYQKRLKLGPYGRKRFREAEVEEPVKKESKLRSLSKPKKAN